jgi:hypothetical protein
VHFFQRKREGSDVISAEREDELSNFAKLKLKLNYSICKEKGKFGKVLLCELFRDSSSHFPLGITFFK